MNGLPDTYKHKLYAAHAFITWWGIMVQIIYTIQNQSILIVWWWPAAMLVAELMALPLAWSSKIGIWKVCHIVGAVLCAILLAGVLAYR